MRQRRRNLTLIRMTPDLIYDQLIGAGCAAKLVFSWGGNPGVGSLHRLRDAVENSWPAPLAVEEHAHAGMAAAYAAGASGLPFGVLRGYLGTDLPKYNKKIKFIECPFTGEKLAAVPAHRPDVTVIHAQKADRKGNVLIWGVVGVQKEAVLAAKRSIITVEEIVDRLDAPPNSLVLPSWVVGAVCQVKGGAFPSYAQGYYPRNNAFYKKWDGIARERESFQKWIEQHVMGTKDFEGFRQSLEQAAQYA
jgi:glutaconate CoA-transferase subunit A